uniref:EF-hand domain-containing protein n=1 Tax=viral metagenome TaxID=1070528 RepID=A0A6C0H743_9ZZZZ
MSEKKETIFHYINEHIMYLNNSKFFAGVIIILLNIGSKFITIQFSKSTEAYLKLSVTKQILIFGMSWMGTRDIYCAFILTAVFTILTEHLFNEESKLCVVPHKYRILATILDSEKNGTVTSDELNTAIGVLEKAKREKLANQQKEAFALFHKYTTNY